MTYQPKKGDRVKATLTYEGVVIWTTDGRLGLDIAAMNGVPEANVIRHLDLQLWSFEKLPDPEPEWVNGDVIELLGVESKYVNRFEYHLIDGAWTHCAGGTLGESVSDYWREGRVKILHKADAQKAA